MLEFDYKAWIARAKAVYSKEWNQQSPTQCLADCKPNDYSETIINELWDTALKDLIQQI